MSFLFRATSATIPMAWAEDRAMLGSNPSADSGTKTEAGCPFWHPVLSYIRSFPNFGIGTNAINPSTNRPRSLFPCREPEPPSETARRRQNPRTFAEDSFWGGAATDVQSKRMDSGPRSQDGQRGRSHRKKANPVEIVPGCVPVRRRAHPRRSISTVQESFHIERLFAPKHCDTRREPVCAPGR